MRSLDWNDFQFVLRVAEKGSLAAGARAMGVNHTTALRRVHAFERQLGVRLFERLAQGYVLTGPGEEFVRTARAMDELAAQAERRILGHDLQLTGTVRVTTTDSLASSILPRHLEAFRAKHPEVHLELTTSNAVLSLTRRDADVAIRPMAKPSENLVGRRISDVAFAVYAAAALLEHAPDRAARELGAHREGAAARELGKYRWIAPDESLSNTTVHRWMARKIPNESVVLHADSFVAMRAACAAGIGVAALPCYLGDLEPRIRRVQGPIPSLASELWVLTHEDLRTATRIRAFSEFIGDALAGERELIQGAGIGPKGTRASTAPKGTREPTTAPKGTRESTTGPKGTRESTSPKGARESTKRKPPTSKRKMP
ncbi:LysR family transcriptional regulator [Pendulispora albinea]|uniref:LysR family transcriptional regulator n=1 Tax=Pendulispora albinea TaxID=2741071 RepID=A0ABZ2LPJ0_9BACT